MGLHLKNAMAKKFIVRAFATRSVAAPLPLPMYISAPMVNISERSVRMFWRNECDIQLAYTPMLLLHQSEQNDFRAVRQHSQYNTVGDQPLIGIINASFHDHVCDRELVYICCLYTIANF